MGARVVGDIWLSHLVMPGMPGDKIAMSLLRAQAVTFAKRQHLIALNDEFPRKRIQQDIPLGKMPRCYARCIRCGCVAWLNDWVNGAVLTEEARLEQIDLSVRRGDEGRVGFLQLCRGDEYLANIIRPQPEEMEEHG